MNNQSIVADLRKRSLNELLNMLPGQIMIATDVVKFVLSKDSDKKGESTFFTCYAIYKFGSGFKPYFYKGGKMEFSSNNPELAVAMMIGFLKAEKLMS